MGDNRAIVYVENAVPIYRASALGNPLRCLTSARAGNTPLEPPEYLRKAAEAGTRYEVIVKDRLTDEGWVIDDEQGFVECRVDLTEVEYAGSEYAVIRGHLDAISIYHPDDPMDDRMLEVKSMSANVNQQWVAHRFDSFPTYAAQLTFYMAAVDKPALYAVVNRDTDELELVTYDEPPMDPESLFNKVRSVEALNAQGIMPPCSGAKYQCAYSYMCDKAEISPADLAAVGDEAALAAAVERYDEARSKIGEYEILKEAAKEDIITALSGRKKADVGLSRVSHTASTRRTLNTKRLRERLGDEMDEFYDEKQTTTLRVTKSKETA